jgi:hypothetical protein
MEHGDASGAARRGVADQLRAALVLCGAFCFFTSFDLFAYASGSGPKPAVLVYAFCAAAGALALLQASRPTSLHRSPVVLWLVFFVLVNLAWGVTMSGAQPAFQELVDRMRSMILLAACLVVFDDPRARRLGLQAVGVAVVLVSLLNVAELLRLVEFSSVENLRRVPGRAGGFYGDANAAGQCIALGLALAVPSLPRRWGVPLLVVGAAGIAATFSRSAAACFVVLFAWLLWRRTFGAGQLGVLVLCGVAAVSLGIGYLQSFDVLNDNTAARLAGDTDDNGRALLAWRAWDSFLSAPWAGSGLGSTNLWEAMPHNTFLALAVDHGVLGLLAFPALGLALAAADRASVGFAMALMTAGLFSHTIVQGRPFVFLIALAAATAAVPATRAAHAAQPRLSTA